MKQLFTLLTISFFALTPALSQRTVDLHLTLTSPGNSDTIAPMQSFPITVSIRNTGPDTLTATDTLAYYLLINSDSLTFFPENENHIDYTDNVLIPGDSLIITRTMIFDNSFLGETIELCVFAKPKNASDPVSDPQWINNKGCAIIAVMDEAALAEEQQQHVLISPNPGDHFTLQKKNGGPVEALYIMDQSGKRYDPVMLDDHTIDCSGMPAGMYLLVVDGIVYRIQVL
jgi:hypothetical protein